MRYLIIILCWILAAPKFPVCAQNTLLLMGAGGSGGGGVTLPTGLSGLQFWISADCITTGPCAGSTEGTTIVTWADRSGSARNLSSGNGVWHANKINSLPAVTMGFTEMPLASTIAWSGGITIFVVFANNQTSSKGSLITGGADSFKLWVVNSGKQQGADLSQAAEIGTGTAAADTSWHQTNVTYNGSVLAFRLGKASDGGATNAQTITAATDTVGSSPGSGEDFKGDLAEMFVFNRVLNGTEIGQMESYLTSRYGL